MAGESKKSRPLDDERESVLSLVPLLVLLALPLIELGLLIKVGQTIGLVPTLLVVVGTGIVGAAVLRTQGLSAAFKVQEALARDEPPVAAMLDSAFLIGAGILLITPGVLADTIGLALLVPFVRRTAMAWLTRRMTGVTVVTVRRSPADGGGEGPREPRVPPREAGGPVIEGDFERLDEKPMESAKGKTDRPGDS